MRHNCGEKHASGCFLLCRAARAHASEFRVTRSCHATASQSKLTGVVTTKVFARIATFPTKRPRDGLRGWRSLRIHGLLANLSRTQHGRRPLSQPRRSITDAKEHRRSCFRRARRRTQHSHPPPSTHVDDALRHALVRLDDDARTEQPWVQNVGCALALLAFSDSESRVLRVASTGAGRVFPGRLEPARTYRIDMEGLVSEEVFPSRGPLDASSVETCVSRERLVRYGGFGGRAGCGRVGLRGGFGPKILLSASTFSRNMKRTTLVWARNPASRVLRRIELERRSESGSAPDRVTGHPVRPTSSSGRKRRLGDGCGIC
ncbi:hypothetical protein EDB85DRAFT_1896823 [Lactarius pseudohatsudake]|nr:hypothetical protein EDB85DRAFT_1896823 [Lactarius pseudohatsudake]